MATFRTSSFFKNAKIPKVQEDDYNLDDCETSNTVEVDNIWKGRHELSRKVTFVCASFALE